MSEKYDVVIIGAGIGGLVCGCYLSKAGLKVLIVEQHDKPGGYCTSFTRQGFNFDVGIHYLGGVKKGLLGKIFKEIGVFNYLKFSQFNPTDIIIMPDKTVEVMSDIQETIKNFKIAFPGEKTNINKFFELMLRKDFFSLYLKFKKHNFAKLLDLFFEDAKLKSTIEVLLGNMGISAHRISAISGVIFFREFIADPGWYPDGGIQRIPDILVKIIKRNNGKIILSKKVEKVVIKNRAVKGVILEGEEFINTNAVISNADAEETFSRLVTIGTREEKLLKSMQVSPSIFCVYLGLENDFGASIKNPATIWYLSSYNVNKCFDNFYSESIIKGPIKFLSCILPFNHDKSRALKPTMQLFTGAPFKTKKFWDKERDAFMEMLICKIEEIIPDLRGHIDLKFNSTPQTFYRYSLNKNGAAFGWASTVELMRRPKVMNITSIKNLFLAGHWCNGGLSQGGVPQVAVMGRTAARSLIESLGLNWKYRYNFIT